MVVRTGREEATSSLLTQLPTDTWAVVTDAPSSVGLPGNVGQVAIGPPGIFVIGTKGWSGTVEVRDDVLRHDGRARATAIADASDAASAVARLVPMVPRAQVRPVLCFVRAEPISASASGVIVCSTVTLVATLSSLPPVLSPAEVRRVASELGLALPVRPRPTLPWAGWSASATA